MDWSSSFAKQTCAFAPGLLLLAAISGCSEEAKPATDPGESRETKVQGSRPAIDPAMADKFRVLAPADWTLRETHEAAALYDVRLASGSGGKPIVVRGAVLLDGRFERYLSSLTFSPSVVAREREKFGAVPEEYPKVNGFQAVVDSNSLGFDAAHGIHRRSIKYFNRDQGVFCRGTSPGLLKCLWGNPQVRLVLDFHSDHTAAVLEYLKQNVFSE